MARKRQPSKYETGALPEGALFCLIFLRQPFVPAMVVVFRGKGDDSAGKVMSIRK
ncbi:MAG: hypothetical protein ACLTZY_00790 [Alistipes indistinctus]